jgi:Zn-dependent metalloprotease
MRILRGLAGAAGVALAATAAMLPGATPSAQERGPRRLTVAASSQADVREWHATTDAMLRTGELRVRQRRADTLIAGRTIERADQYYKGVRVFGADVARQLAGGVAISEFGTLYTSIDVSADPTLSADEARARVERLAGAQGTAAEPELVVLPERAGPQSPSSSYRLAWRLRAVTASADIVQYFLDAHSGEVVRQYSDRQTQSAVGRATGVLGDSKKISVSGGSGRFNASDLLRPPSITTYDLKGDAARTSNVLNGVAFLSAGDIASDDDNNWTDGAVDDAHVYAGWTYDFYFKRFGRRGLDNNNIRILSIANPARRENFATEFDRYPDFFVNAFYAGSGIMVYGVGLPPGVFLSSPLGRQTMDATPGALDIVTHELTHGVTEFSSNLIYLNESGALNEAFSDIMGTSAEFFYQPAGSGVLQADYTIGEDVIRPGGVRSLANPAVFGDPDHYSKRFLGPEDNGGVHTNSCIASHAFYLAIEGGTNRTSGIAVQGVGAGNREQMEKVFYRGFVQLLPSDATFAVARAATIQAARDLYGPGSSAERAVTQAWTAVGVQ